MPEERLTSEASVALRGFKTYLVAECGLAQRTVTAYAADLEYFLARHPDFLGVSLPDVITYVRHLAGAGAKATSLNRRLSSLRVFYRYLVREGVLASSPLELMEAPKVPSRLPDYLDGSAVENILGAASAAAAADTPDGRKALRDGALLALAYACGLRASELVGLKWADVDLSLRLVRVRGKGGKERLVPFGAVATDFLERHRAALGDRAAESPYVFASARRRGPISRQLLWLMVKKYAARAGVPGVKPHLFRHTFATHLIQAGADIRTVQELLGHANITTTQLYAHLDTRTLTAFHEKYHPRK
jgi:integrase/recombinase XerD